MINYVHDITAGSVGTCWCPPSSFTVSYPYDGNMGYSWTVCRNCSTNCLFKLTTLGTQGFGYYISSPCTSKTDIQCTACTTKCPKNTTSACNGTTTKDVGCVSCQSCTQLYGLTMGVEYYMDGSCLGGQNPMPCQLCTPTPLQGSATCPYGSYFNDKTCNGVTNSSCTICSCPTGKWFDPLKCDGTGIANAPCISCSTSCKPGYTLQAACSTNADLICTPCAAGKYKSSTGTQSCTSCTTGSTFTPAVGYSSPLLCKKNCDPGFKLQTFCTITSDDVCVQCEPGTYKATTDNARS